MKKQIRKIQYRLKAKDGQFIIHPKDRQMIKNALQIFDGQELIGTIELDKKKRTLARNNHYWGFVIPVACQGFIDAGTENLRHNESSYITVHRLFKGKFLDNGHQLITANAEVVNVPPSTATLSNKEFDEYVEHIRQWCAENLNTEIPYRGENMPQPDFAYVEKWENL